MSRLVHLLLPVAFDGFGGFGGFGGAGGQSTLISLVPMIAIFAIFYFLLVGPMRKRQKALSQLVENLKKGDRVITNGGLYGEVAAVDAGVVILKVADNVKLRVAKSAIAGLEGEADKGGKP
ncbi:MAG TPA: preprotein translocase subunit YajC [Thermoanaerobaculia bacterium]|nr:preprotein translocase subunit YajC [Thermoanaerobaculia bacterium]